YTHFSPPTCTQTVMRQLPIATNHSLFWHQHLIFFFLCDWKLFSNCSAVLEHFSGASAVASTLQVLITHRFSFLSISFIFHLCFYVGSDNERLVYNSCHD
ncbi:hypothetical protein GOODEAATRI_023490, partial [Goodea atripinnis]